MRRAPILALAGLMLAAPAPAAAALSGLSWSRSFAGPGANLWAGFVASTSATASFAIVNAAGARVRDLGDGVALTAGDHAVDWDGYGDTTRPVSDGVYTLAVSWTGADGSAGTLSAPITIDGTPPRVDLVTHRLRRSTTVRIRVTDNFSGVSEARLIVDRQRVLTAAAGSGLIRYRPRGGWAPGHHAIAVRAFDRAGNSVLAIRTLAVGR